MRLQEAGAQVLLSALPVQAYFLSPDQLTKKGLFGGAMREVLEASQGEDAPDGFDLICGSYNVRCKPYSSCLTSVYAKSEATLCSACFRVKQG